MPTSGIGSASRKGLGGYGHHPEGALCVGDGGRLPVLARRALNLHITFPRGSTTGYVSAQNREYGY
jgi:hypothetical protein